MARSKELSAIYWKLRAAGNNAAESMLAAKIIAQFNALEARGLVRVRVKVDTDPDLSFFGGVF